MIGLVFTLLAPLLHQAVQPAVPGAQAVASTLTISVDQTAYTGEPLWVRLTAVPPDDIRYPFHQALEDMGCNRLEVKRDGALLTPRPLHSIYNGSGILCGSAAPRGAPQNRLPIHILYPLDTPGTYSIRWIRRRFGPPSGETPAPETQSGWLSFQVLPTTPEQHEAWLARMLANPPTEDGLLAGDYLPSLAAAAPEPRALGVFVRYLYAENPMVAGMAASALELYPKEAALQAIAASLEQHGPGDALAYYATYHTGWTHDQEEKIVRATVPYLQSPVASAPGKESPTGASSSVSAAAVKLLRFIFFVPNHAWPADPELAAYANEQVLEAAPAIMANGNANAVQELSEYLGAMPSSSRSHALLLQIADRPDNAGIQAKIATTWHPQAEDLAHLAAALTAPGDGDSRGTDRSSLPYSLVHGYGDAALPYLEKAVSDSPYIWVKVSAAYELVLKNRRVGFQFLLDQLVLDTWPANKAYKPQLVRWVCDHFPKDLPRDASAETVVSFLRAHLAASS